MENLKDVKCVVWDLDHTVWEGILLESTEVHLKDGIVDIIKEIDRRGILQSIASKNEIEPAMEKLKQFGIADYFIYPQINWDAKSSALTEIQKELNIGLDTFLFIDDQPYERDEVSSVHADVLCVDSVHYQSLLAMPRMNPRFITEDSVNRRKMYLDDHRRKVEQAAFKGPEQKFLESLAMRFTISEATQDDLQRVEELTIRTNQLNSTGVTYNYDELDALRKSKTHKLLICELIDKYGSYGKIGLALVEIQPEALRVKLILMSCRVVSRGVGAVLLSFVMKEGAKRGSKVVCDFRHTGKNRMMYATLKFQGFTDVLGDSGETVAMSNNCEQVQDFPGYIDLSINVNWEEASV